MDNKKNNVHFGIENIANFLIGLVGILTLISLFGINFLEIITSITIVAAAVALITKDFLADFLSGIYLSFSNAFEINDLVKLDNQRGKVVEITMLKTKILNDDDDIVIIPNSKVHYNDIINYTKRDPRRIDVDFELDNRYVKDLDDLEKQLFQALNPVKMNIEEENYILKVEQMKQNYMELKFQFTLIPLEMDEHRRIRRRAKRLIFNYLVAKY